MFQLMFAIITPALIIGAVAERIRFAAVMIFVAICLHGQGFIVAQIFSGLWLFPFGILVIRSGFIPRFLGVLLFIAGSGYLASSFTSLLLPSYRHLVDQFAMVLTAGELPIIFWLLIWGAKDRPLDEQSALSSGG